MHRDILAASLLSACLAHARLSMQEHRVAVDTHRLAASSRVSLGSTDPLLAISAKLAGVVSPT